MIVMAAQLTDIQSNTYQVNATGRILILGQALACDPYMNSEENKSSLEEKCSLTLAIPTLINKVTKKVP